MKTQNPASPATLAGMVDYVIEAGETTVDGGMVWYWRKWASGTAECWGTTPAQTGNFSKAWGSVYVLDLPSGQNAVMPYKYPFEFTVTPNVLAMPVLNDGNYWLYTQEKIWTNQSPRYNAARPNQYNNATVRASLYVVGKWK